MIYALVFVLGIGCGAYGLYRFAKSVIQENADAEWN
jgi:hypothetical protein